jgi:hypothetical protein
MSGWEKVYESEKAEAKIGVVGGRAKKDVPD